MKNVKREIPKIQNVKNMLKQCANLSFENSKCKIRKPQNAKCKNDHRGRCKNNRVFSVSTYVGTSGQHIFNIFTNYVSCIVFTFFIFAAKHALCGAYPLQDLEDFKSPTTYLRIQTNTII